MQCSVHFLTASRRVCASLALLALDVLLYAFPASTTAMEGAEEAFVESVEDPIMGEGLQEEREEPVAGRGSEGSAYAIMGNKIGRL